MGRRSVDSSPSSAETSFRELDDVFLQTQARIWLGEVLKFRLDEQLSISDLLADGELLFEVSETLWSLLLEKCVELRHIKAYQFPLGSRKSSGRYKPYSNVDSFLKVCKILGLNGIDLFSPSDVVEKRNTRKVCICIRAISKKARSKQLKVPDFDLVTYAVVMSTDMVGCIRRSLESSQCSISSCSGSNSYKQTRSRNPQRKLTTSQNGNYDSCSEDSDEAESTYFGIESYSSSMEKADHPATLILDPENAPGAFSAVKQYTRRQVSIRSDARSPYRNVKPYVLQHSGNDNQANNLSASYSKSQGDLRNKDMHKNNNIRDDFENMSDLAGVDRALRNDNSGVGDSMFDDIAGTNFISDYLAFSDSVVLGNNPSSSLFLDGEESVCNFFMSIDSHGIDSMSRTFPNGFRQRSLDEMEDVEVSSTASMSSILGRVLDMDFDDQYNGGDSSMVKVHSIIKLFEKGTESQDEFFITEGQTQDSSLCEIFSQCSATDIEESHSALQLENEGICTNFNSSPENNRQPYIMKPKKLDICGDSEVPRITFSTDNADLAPVEDDNSSFERMDLMKALIGASDSNPDLKPHSSDNVPLNSLHHKICTEAKVSCDKVSIEGNESHVCSLGYENVSVPSVTCPDYEQLNGNSVNHNFNFPVNECESTTEEQPSPSAKNARNVTGGVHQTCTSRSGSSHLPSNGSEDFQNENNMNISTVNFSDREDQRSSVQQDKPRRKSLLNTVVTGTTLIGVLFLLLHIRKGKEDTDKTQKPLKSQRFGAAWPTSQRSKSNGGSNGTYPAEKLKFGN